MTLQAEVRPDRALVSRLRARGLSLSEVGGVLGCKAKSIGFRVRAAAVDEAWDRHGRDARALVATLADERNPRIVGSVYLAVLHEWLMAQAPDEVRGALEALGSLASVSFDTKPVERRPIAAAARIEPRPDWKRVVQVIAEREGLEPSALMSARADREVSIPRDEIWWMLRQMRRAGGHRWFSGPVIGRMFKRDHTTVFAGVRRHTARRAVAGLPVDDGVAS